MKNKKITVILIAAFVLVIGGAYILYGKLSDTMQNDKIVQEKQSETETAKDSEDEENSDVQNKKAPDFTVTDEEGKEVALSDFIGKPVILNFWASWCGPCKSEMPDFDEAYGKYGNDIQFMMVNLTDNSHETVEAAKDFIKEQGYAFPVFYDTKMEASDTYTVFSIPVTYFIDSEGNIVAHGSGALDRESLQTGIDMLFKK